MRAKRLFLLAAAAAIVAGASGAATAAQKNGKPLKPATIDPADSLASNPAKDSWRERALKARAQAPEAATPMPPQGGTARAIDERGDRTDGHESGAGDPKQDRGE